MYRLSRSIAVARSLPRPAPRRTFALGRPVLATSKPSVKDDPYPLPLSPEHVSPERDSPKAQADEPIQLDKEVDLSDPALPFPDPLPRDGESVEQMRARLVYQTRKRGTLESDLLMSTFAKEYMGTMSEFELREFDKLLDENDWDTFYWMTGKRQPPPRWANSPLMEKLVKHARNDEKVARRMPSL